MRIATIIAVGALVCVTACGGGSSTPPTPLYTVGGVVSGLSGGGLVLQNNGRDDLSISGSGSFVFTTPAAPGTRYSVTLKNQPLDPGLNCVVMNAGRVGVVQNANVTGVSVVCAEVARIAFVFVQGIAGSVALRIDPGTGALTLLSESQTQGYFMPAPGGHYAYSSSGGGVGGFAIDQASGSIMTLVGSPFGVGIVPTGCPVFPNGCSPVGVTQLALDPRGQHLYAYYAQETVTPPVVPLISEIVTFLIDPGSGALTSLPMQVQGGRPTTGMQIDPRGRFLYSADPQNIHLGTGGGVGHYLIDSMTGGLTSSGVDGIFLWPFAFEPQGNFAYAADSPNASAQAFAVDPAGGALTHVGSDILAPGLSNLVVDVAGAFAYGGCTGGMCVFSLDPVHGELTAASGSPFPMNAIPTALVLDPSGRFAFGICGAAICVYALDPATGTPKLAPASPFTIAGVTPLSIVVTN